MNNWFRSWHGAPTDSKWLVIARKAGVVPGVVAAIVWALFDHASQSEERGSINGFDIETYAAFSGFEEEQIQAVIDALKDKGVVGPDGGFKNWSKRQPKREDGAAERAKTWREQQRTANERKRTQANADERKRTPEKSREEERRAEQEEDYEDTASADHHQRVYAFEAGVIRLVETDLARWVKAFPAISVEAELYSLADWAGRPENRAKWFNAVAGALAKKNRDAIDRKAKNEAEVIAGVQSANRSSFRTRGLIP